MDAIFDCVGFLLIYMVGAFKCRIILVICFLKCVFQFS